MVNQVQVPVDQAVSDVLAELKVLIIDIKAGKLISDLGANLNNIVKLVGEVPQIPADVKSAPQACLNSAALGVADLAGALLGLQSA